MNRSLPLAFRVYQTSWLAILRASRAINCFIISTREAIAGLTQLTQEGRLAFPEPLDIKGSPQVAAAADF